MTQKYFNQLNYTLGNEDTGVDVEIVKKLGSKSIFNVAGCGSRGLPLMACESVESIEMGDVSPYQLALCRLRTALYRALDYNEFLQFFDFPPYGKQDNSYARKKLFSRLELVESDRHFFKDLFEQTNWQSLLYSGKWERTFQTMSKALQLLMRKERDQLFSFYHIDEQREYFLNTFSGSKWNSILFLLGNKSVFNALLYKGDFIEKNVRESHYDYYKKAFEQLFTHNLARESFFAHLCFYGRINHSDGNPIEADKLNFYAVKNKLEMAASDSVRYSEGNLLDTLSERSDEFDYIGLSDVPSYFKGEVEKNFLQTIKPSLKKGGVVCLRNYLRVPQADTHGYEEITHDFIDLYPKEKVGVYRFGLFRKL